MTTLAAVRLLVAASVLVLAVDAFAQQNYVYSAGSPTFSTTIPVQNGFINISNGNLHLEFGLASHPQRGVLSLNERLVYDSKFWMIGHYSNYYWWPDNVSRSTQLAAGWRFVNGAETGSISVSPRTNQYQCGSIDVYGEAYTYDSQYSYAWQDPSGTQHSFSSLFYTHRSDCDSTTQPSPESVSGRADDGSGYEITMVGDDQNGPQNVYVKDPSGNQVYPQAIDRYGNYWSSDGNGNLIDDRGQTPVIRTDNGNTIDFAVLAASGNRVHYIVTTTPVAIHTDFNPGTQPYDWQGSLTAVQDIQLPDGTHYSFTYDSGSGTGHYGTMTSMTLPTGGVIQYGWSNFLDSYQNQNRWLTGYQVGNDSATTFSPQVLTQCSATGTGCQERVTLHRPSGDEVQYTLVLNNGAWNTTTDVYSGAVSSNNKLTSTASNYDFSQPCGAGCIGSQYIQKQTSTTTLVDVGLNSTTLYSYDDPSTGKPSSIKQYDFYSGSLPSMPLTETQYTYSGFDLTEEKVFDGHGYQSANQVSDTVYHYGTSAAATSGVVQHGPQNAGGPYLSSVDHWIGGSSYLTTSLARDDTGAVLSSTDPNGTTGYGYDATNAFVTSTTLPIPWSGVQLSTSETPSASTGETTQTTGYNGEQTNTYYDTLGRLDHVTLPNTGTTSYTYYNARDTGTYTTLSSGVSSELRTLLDLFGRPERVANFNGQPGNSYYQQDTCYDANGRASAVSVPYQGQGYNTPKTCSGTHYTYDALDRPYTTQNADGTTQFSYRGRATSVTDVNGVKTITQVDGLGRTSAVCEVTTDTSADGYQNCGLDIAGSGLLTSYSYNGGTHSTAVSQSSQQRTFTTDALGRTTSVSEPERGTTTYSYAYNGNGLQVTRSRAKANQTNASVLTTTTMQYDRLGRPLFRSYDDNLTPTRYWWYDQSAPWLTWSTTPTNTKGRLAATQTSDSADTRSLFSYDSVGNVASLVQCAPSICANAGTRESRPLSFAYDLAGNLTDEHDTLSGGISYNRSPAGEVTSASNSSFDGAGNSPGTGGYALVSNVVNGPFGPTSWSLGSGLQGVQLYDSLGRVRGKWVCSGSSSETAPEAVSCTGATSTTPGTASQG